VPEDKKKGFGKIKADSIQQTANSEGARGGKAEGDIPPHL
jgi:hypothetical protein